MHSVTSNAVNEALSNRAYGVIAGGTVPTFAQLMGETLSYEIYHVADYIDEHIAEYSNGQFFNITIGGPAYTGVVFKYSNSYFKIMFVGYANLGVLLCSHLDGGYRRVEYISSLLS